MKAIILAAGIGSRFKSSKPKCMITINDKTIIENQINNLYSAGIRDITVVVGYKFYMIMEHVSEITRDLSGIEVKYVLNEYFNSTNTSKSLLKGLKSLSSSDSSIIWMNGDVVFPDTIIGKFIQDLNHSHGLLLTNTNEVSDEEIKYLLNEDGNIIALSKEVDISKAVGEAVGINSIPDHYLSSFIKALDKVDDNDYFEKAIELMINDKFFFYPISTNDQCVEIDFVSDLELLK